MDRVNIGGKLEELGSKLGEGGEGKVFALRSNDRQAVKIYKEKFRAARVSKVRAMVALQLAAGTDLVAFPIGMVTDTKGQFLGFNMRLVSGYRPIHELYSPKSRKRHFPQTDFRFLVRAALNMARAVGKVHQAGCIIGDFNHSGVLVANDATVSLIDADSFQFSNNATTFPCDVGVADFTPPELQGLNLAGVERTKSHDHFGLAVAIFHLLLMGKHPYAGRFAGGDIGMGEAIAQNRFAFSKIRAAQTRTTPPPASIVLDDFPPTIAESFETAFGIHPSRRPDSSHWIQALKDLEVGLSRCGVSKPHYYPSGAKGCVWCRVASQSGVDMFPDLTGFAPRRTQIQFDLDRIANELRSIRLPSPAELLPSWTGSFLAESAAVIQFKRARANSIILGAASIIAAIIGFWFVAEGALVWLGTGLFGAFKLMSAGGDAAPLIKSYERAAQNARDAELAFLKKVGLEELTHLRAELDGWIGSYRQLDRQLDAGLADLKRTREQRQKTEFLDQFSIRKARITGIGPAKTATLASYGVETAADVSPNAVLAVPGFGEAMMRRLLLWRSEKEAKFRYNPAPSASDVKAEAAVRTACASKKANLETKIKDAFNALRDAPQRLSANANRIDQALQQAIQERAEAENDLLILKISVPTLPAIVFAPPATQPARPSTRVTPLTQTNTYNGPSCPRCGASMRRRTARQGMNAGNQFWGCSRYPSCRGTRN